MQAKVSIIVPCWGVEKYLDRCVESLVNQTLRDIEIILVDDESPDHVPEMCEGWKDKDARIKVIHKKNEGLGMACNSGLEVATGEYIAFCDSDDWVELDTYEKMYITALRTEADAVYCGIQTIDDAGIVKIMNHYKHFEVIHNKSRIYEFGMDMICSRPDDPIESHIAMSAKIVLYRRYLIEKFGIRFESERKLISEDLIWNLDFLSHSSIITTMPEIFYYYYNNDSSISKRVRLDRFVFFKAIRTELLRRTSLMGYPNDVKERIDRMFIRYVRHQIGEILLSNFSKHDQNKVVTEMLKDNEFQDVINSYPVKLLTNKQQLIILLMKHNCQSLLKILFKIKR